ncbi:hypothetical protein PMIT1323_02391 [Prochlorococcus marinus str. MIT 1323]|nr:hypothetical protein PMIT1323_02391 [Prochlorococcus marinus str. MIT 1323]
MQTKVDKYLHLEMDRFARVALMHPLHEASVLSVLLE